MGHLPSLGGNHGLVNDRTILPARSKLAQPESSHDRLPVELMHDFHPVGIFGVAAGIQS